MYTVNPKILCWVRSYTRLPLDSDRRSSLGAGVPCVPGYHGGRQEPDFLFKEAEKIGRLAATST